MSAAEWDTTGTAIEAWRKPQSSRADWDVSGRGSEVEDKLKSLFQDLAAGNENSHGTAPLYRWSALIGFYSGLKPTNPSDKIPAILGLTSVVAKTPRLETDRRLTGYGIVGPIVMVCMTSSSQASSGKSGSNMFLGFNWFSGC